MNSPPCRAGLAQGGQVRVRARRVAGLGRAPAHRALHHPDLGVQLGVGLAERHAGPHVEQMADGSPGVAGGPGLRHVGRHRGGRIEQPAVGQHPGYAADERLRHRHEQVRGGGCHAVVVPFGHQLPVVQHDQSVGAGVREYLRRRRRTAVEPPDRRVGQRAGRGGQRRRPSASCGGDDPAGLAACGAGPSPPEGPAAAISWLGMISRMCLKAHLLNGGSCQLARVTCASGAGGKPVMSPSARSPAAAWAVLSWGMKGKINRTRARRSVI